MSNMIWVYVHWRGDMLAFNEPTQIYSHGGWGFFNPTKESYDAFVEMGDTYRLNASIKTYRQMEDTGYLIEQCHSLYAGQCRLLQLEIPCL